MQYALLNAKLTCDHIRKKPLVDPINESYSIPYKSGEERSQGSNQSWVSPLRYLSVLVVRNGAVATSSWLPVVALWPKFSLQKDGCTKTKFRVQGAVGTLLDTVT